MVAQPRERRVSTDRLSSGEVLIEDVEVESGELVARSGTLLDTRLIADLRERGIEQVRIKAQVDRKPAKPGTRAYKQVERCVRDALVEIAPRFRRNNLGQLPVKTLFHACALQRARLILLAKRDRKRQRAGDAAPRQERHERREDGAR